MTERVVNLDAERRWRARVAAVNERLEVIAGDPVIGTLSPNTLKDFVTASEYDERVLEYEENIKARIAQQTAQDVFDFLEHGDREGIEEYLSEVDAPAIFANDSEASKYYRAKALADLTQRKFIFNLRTELRNWTHSIEVRRDFKVVHLGKKYHL